MRKPCCRLCLHLGYHPGFGFYHCKAEEFMKRLSLKEIDRIRRRRCLKFDRDTTMSIDYVYKKKRRDS